MSFELHPNLHAKAFVCDLPLCRVLLEDNALYPWIFLVPRKNNAASMRDLSTAERQLLMREMELCEGAMARLFAPDQTNVAAIGNVTPQLHVHIICRFRGDPAWPGTVWGQAGKPYEPAAKTDIINRISQEIRSCQK